MPATERIFTSETFYFRIPNVKQNGSAVTDAANTPDTFTYQVKDVNGAVLSPDNTGDMAHSASTDGTWEAIVTAPSAPGTYHLHGVITTGTSVGFFHDTVNISSRQ